MYENIKYFKDLYQLKNHNFKENKKYIIFASENNNFSNNNFSFFNIDYYIVIFPKIIFNSTIYDYGFLLFELKQNIKILFYEDILTSKFNLDDFEGIKTVMTLFDGTSSSSSIFVEKLFEHTQLGTNIFGAGAGSFDKDEMIFTKNGLYKNAALVLLFDKKIDTSISHGWEYLKGPFIVTKVKDNVILEIDYENAYDVYKKVIEEDCQKKLTKDSLVNISVKYPFGIVKFSGESLIRDPINIDKNGGLVLAGNIQPNTVFNILKGDKKSLIDASSDAIKKILNKSVNTVFMFECISRYSFLEDSFKDELNEVLYTNGVSQIHGAVSIGEVGNDGNRYIYIQNKSCTMGGLCH